MDKELQRYLKVLRAINAPGSRVSKEDLRFFAGFSPSVDETVMQKIIEGGEFANPQEAQAALQQASIVLQSSPVHKEKMLEIASEKAGNETSEKVTQGLNILLAGSDILTSINQIQESKSQLSKSRKPSRPAVPQRDAYLQQALRGAQQGTYDTQRALAPVQAEIQDQYQTDIVNAKTASTGQAGQFGAYAQQAADRRNRAAMQLAPISDSIKAREQGNYNNLLGMRANETQQMFQNQAQLYPYDLQQYRTEQESAGALGATGRENLRNSMFGLASQIPNIAKNRTRDRWRQAYNTMSMYGEEPAKIAADNQEYLDQQFTPWM